MKKNIFGWRQLFYLFIIHIYSWLINRHTRICIHKHIDMDLYLCWCPIPLRLPLFVIKWNNSHITNSHRHQDYYLTHHFGWFSPMKIKGFLWFMQLIHIIHVFSFDSLIKTTRALLCACNCCVWVVYSFVDIDFIIHMWPIYQIYVLRFDDDKKQH